MKNYELDPELKFLKPLRYKKYSNIRRIFLNIIFNMSMVFSRPNKQIEMKKYIIKGYQNHNIKIYVLRRKKSIPNKKGLLYLHGGGFEIEGTPVHIHMISNIINDSGHTAVFVKYRLAPKYPFPIGLEDCYQAYLWMLKEHKFLNIDQKHISVAGDSAGGNLAVGVALLARDRLNQTLDRMLLFYPVVDHRQITPSMKEFDDTPMWNSILNKNMWEVYLRHGDFGMLNYTSLLLGDLKGLPKTYIETAEFDCLRDEGIWLAEKLKSLDIEVIERHTKNSVHGYDAVFFSDFIKERIKDRSSFLQGELKNEED